MDEIVKAHSMILNDNIIYNRFGRPELQIIDDGRLVDFHGTSAGFIDGNSVYNYRGRHIGWFENGIFRDPSGNVVGFTPDVTDYPRPILPLTSIPPIPAIPSIEPIRPIESIPPIPPIKSFGWSTYTPIELFNMNYG